MRIIIVDYGMGNTSSVIKAFTRAGFKADLSSSIEDINKADRIVLPGVGHYSEGVRNLDNKNLRNVLNKKVLNDKTPFLGICLGMQLLGDCSEEGPGKGLGFIKGKVIKFKFHDIAPVPKIPHMGWNSIEIQKENILYTDINTEESDFYFVHSYHFVCDEVNDLSAYTEYGYKFASVIQKDNIYGTQFHPEKSHDAGITLIQNFVKGNHYV